MTRSRAEATLRGVPRYHVTTFGCQMNEHDSERMKGMLESLGYAEAPAQAEADLILFNTCSIREKADSRLVAHLGEAKRLKREDPMRVVGVGARGEQRKDAERPKSRSDAERRNEEIRSVVTRVRRGHQLGLPS